MKMEETSLMQLKTKNLSFSTHLHPNSRLTTIVTMETSPLENVEVKHENNQNKIKYEAKLQLHLK